jgi:alanine transaminase
MRLSRRCRDLSIQSLNPAVVRAEYAVRGAILARAQELEQQLQDSSSSLPFPAIVRCNIGNPQAVGQAALTFPRQVLSAVLYPPLLDAGVLPADVVARARAYLASVPSPGAYSDSQGVPVVRQEVAKFIARRDGVAPIDPDEVFLTDGASAGVKLVMQTLISGPDDAVLVPVPQYPLYPATLTLLNGTLLPYYLDEGAGWGANMAELRKVLAEARSKGKTVRGMVVINPGNPTGQSLSKETVQDIVSFCKAEDLALFADEVYQENVYGDAPPFYSARRAAVELGVEGLPVVSFHSISKGFSGECGIRGGYFDLLGVPADVKAQLVKLASISLCSNVPGQFATGLMVNPPSSGEPSYELYAQERVAILKSLARRADRLCDALNALPGVTCNKAEGAMYLFPQIRLPTGAVEAASKAGLAPDAFYCLRLLEATGLCVVPGSGFGQVEGTFHFRTTFLPPDQQIDDVVARLGDFHRGFLSTYA